MTPLQHHYVGRGILVYHASGPQHYIVSLGDCMELVTFPNECFVQVGFKNWPPHKHMSHTYIPTHAHAHATATAPTPATAQEPAHAHTTAPALAHVDSGSTCVTPKWSMPLDIRPSHALPLCACGTPMHPHPNPLHFVEVSNHVTHSF
ncbi:hypothetical protein O181_064696 [Austropuccinia psidii MF-1]|uniref:Uncharacterized protein n=1 Tax=Austropuccinia psidii MF-1 TaxID=1389203 RepID=A0A9Q3I0J1_9BASI|nr:hypothetical protein [Austropuccinia psidii MF-1]